MDAKEVGNKLVDLCKQGKFREAMESLYAENIVSVEPMAMGAMPAETKGKQAVRGKTDWWENNHTVHSVKVAGPFVARNQFIVEFDMDMTDKTTGKRHSGAEAGIYTVEGGKVVREEFFYS